MPEPALTPQRWVWPMAKRKTHAKRKLHFRFEHH